MDSKVAALKICTLLHDPPFKPILLRMYSKGYKKGHEDISREIIEELSAHIEDVNLKDLIAKYSENKAKVIDYADWVASSSDRCLISELSREVYDIYQVNILDTSKQKELNYLVDSILLDKLKDKIEKFKVTFSRDLNEIIGEAGDLPIHIIYHMLWRNLIPLTVKYFNDPNVALLPADTRMPYYTIFDHLYTSSGLIPCLLEGNRLGLIHWEAVGTQAFIKQSRALRDLWASSFLISLLNTAVIIKIANEYGFDAIVNPNMLFNPLVDLYLSSYLKNMRVLLDEIKYPTTPDKGFAFLPFGKVDEYITLIPNWINEIWKNISLSVKEYIEKRLSNLQFTDIYVETLKEYFEEHNQENISPEQLIEIPESNYWEYIWKEVGLDTPIRFICVGEKVDLTPYKIEELLRSYPTITFKNFRKDDNEKLENVKERVINEIKKIREFTKTKYDVNYQFYEFAVVMEYLKMKRKMISEEPRVNLDAWILRNNIYVKDKRALCNVCYSRPAIIFYTNNIMDKVPIKEDERLCPICLVKRVLATLSVKEGKLDKESPFIKVLLSVFQWIDKREEKDYLDAIERSIEEYYSKLVKVLENVLIKTNLPISVIEENILTIPSIDTISSMSFRLTAMKCMNEGFDREFWKILSELIRTLGESPSSVIRDKPPIRWIPNRNVFLFFIGGEWLIEEEIRRIAKERGKNIDDVLKQIRSLFKNINKSVEKCITESNHTVVRNLGKYLAIVRADGDNMGMLTSLSGKKYLKSIKQLILPEFSGYSRNFETYKDLINYTYFATPSYYSMISRTLSVIAKKVVESANEYYSIPIYSGGDDFLAISPSETSLQFSNKIRQIFSMDYLNVNEQNTIIAIPGLTGNATQSCTIHLMHVFTPLYRHLEESITELDEYAKYDETKNSFVVSYNPRKGGKIIAKLPWNINNIAYYILNLISITLDVPKIIMIGKGQTEISPIKMSDRAYRDLLDAYELNDKKLSSEIIKSLFEYEVNRHSEFGDFAKLSTLIPIRSIVDAQIKFKEETSNLLIEVVKATIALKNGMDSNPIMLGESI